VASRPEAHSAADFYIGPWLAQPARNLISSSTTARRLEPQVMDLLVFLAATAGRVVPKDELIDAVWDGRFISETTLTRAVADLRRALGDNQRSPEYIETIPKRGYRLIATVSANGHAGAAAALNHAALDHAAPDHGIIAAGGDHLPSSRRIADRLASERRRRFVGRESEIETFRSALLTDEPSFVALHVNGPGGVGKTTLLEEFARVAHESSRVVVRIDGRNIDASPLGFIVALSRALGADRCELSAVIERWPAGGVLFVDTYEVLTSLDDWLRDTLLPQLPARSLVVIAGRHDPAATWRTNVHWAALTRIHPLGNLDPGDSRTFLDRCGVAAEHHDDALAFTRGHPLALSLTADVLTRGDRVVPARLETEPEVVRLLIEKFVQDVPSPAHRLALHTCVSAHATTEPLLAAALDQADVHDVFEWLGRLSFVESGPYGLFPHDLARDVVYIDFRWRDPDAAYRVTERLIAYLYGRLERTQGLEKLRTWFDVIYLQRYNSRLRPYMDWEGLGTTDVETAKPGDHAVILETVERYEGPASAAIARYWLARQPEAFLVARTLAGEFIGLVAHLRLTAVTADDLAADPALAPAVAHAERHAPPGQGEHITYCRFFMQRERYQLQVPAPVAASASLTWTAPGLAWCFLATVDPDPMEPMFTELHMWRTREADFEVGGRRYGVFAHDWRVENAEQWLRLKAERAWRLDGALPAVQSALPA
jgi:DNA-binding winged helix-turn-helix (wHTH) protein